MLKIRLSNQKLFAGLLGVFLSIAIFLTNYAVYGFGTLLFMFIIYCFLTYITLLKYGFNVSLSYPLIVIWSMHLVYSLILVVSFIFSESLSPEDIRFLAANSINVMWWPVIYILAAYQTELFSSSIKYGYFTLSVIVIICWIVFAVYTGDILFLRHENLPFTFLKFTIFRNPNQFSRVYFLTIIVLYYFYYDGRLNQDKNQFLLKTIIYFGSLIIITTLSRANIFSLILFFALISAINRFGEFQVNKSIILFIIIVLVSYVVITSIDTFQELYALTLSQINMFWNELYADDVKEIRWPRVRTWVATMNIVRDNLFYGVGYDGIKEILREYDSIMLSGKSYGKVIMVHGGFLKVAAYGGIMSLIAFIIFYFSIFRYSIKECFGNYYKETRIASYMVGVLLIVLIPVNIAADSFGMAITWMTLAFLFAQIDVQKYDRSRKC
jgi:hypothetical protein